MVERVKDVDFDRLLEMPIDAVLRLRVQALDLSLIHISEPTRPY